MAIEENNDDAKQHQTHIEERILREFREAKLRGMYKSIHFVNHFDPVSKEWTAKHPVKARIRKIRDWLNYKFNLVLTIYIN